MDTYVPQPTWVILLTLLGFISLARFPISLIRLIYVFFLRPAKNLKSRYGPWAVVTGATDGIGEALAFQLVRQGLHLVLVGRSPDKLRAVTNALCQEYPNAKIKTVVFDLAADDSKVGLRRLREEIEGLDVGVLINNAGVSVGYGTMFHEVEIETWVNTIKVNVRSLTEVTHAVLPGMLERKRGAVVNIGSASMLTPPSLTLFAVYTGTKAYVDQFSRSLYVEYKSRGIDVQCQHPSMVATRSVSENLKLQWFEKKFLALLDPYTRASLRWIGYEPRCLPYLPHFIECLIYNSIPNFITDGLVLRAIVAQREKLRGYHW